MPSDSDKRLLERLQVGDTTAFDELFDYYRPGIFGFLLRLCRDAAGSRYRGGGQLGKQSWAELSRRTFQVDVERCLRCGFSPVRVVAVVTKRAMS
jgi:hypothetical protein